MFVRGVENKLEGIGIGKIQLIKEWLLKYGIVSYDINDDLSINVFSDLNLYLREINLPEYIQFNIIFGRFSCSNGKLTTLRGFPRKITGFFACHNNQLTSTEFFPKEVGGKCYVYGNPFATEESETSIRDEIRSKCKITGQITVLDKI
jgi:hypothetical protein